MRLISLFRLDDIIFYANNALLYIHFSKQIKSITVELKVKIVLQLDIHFITCIASTLITA